MTPSRKAVLAGFATCGFIGVGTFGLEAVLPHAPAQAAVAARALGVIDRANGATSLERFAGRLPFRSRCSTRGWDRSVIRLSNGARILVLGEHASWLRRPTQRRFPLQPSVDLAGCPRVLALLLERRLLHLFLHGGRPILVGSRRSQSYLFELARRPARLELEVSRTTLIPRRVVLFGRFNAGTARLTLAPASAPGVSRYGRAPSTRR